MQSSKSVTFGITVGGLLAYFLPIILYPSFPNIDALIQYRWTYEYALDLKSGFIYSHWAPLEYGGLGGPVFVYYPRVFYCLAMPFVFATKDLSLGLGLTCVFIGVALICVVAFTQRAKFGCNAWFLGLLVLWAPPNYMLQEFIHAYPWYLSAIPLYLLVRASLLQLESKRGFCPGVSLWLAVLYCCHPLSAFMALIAVPCPWIFRLTANRYEFRLVRSFFGWLVAVGLGLLLAGFYLVPSLGLLSLVNPSGWINPGDIGWSNTFVLQFLGPTYWGKTTTLFGISSYVLAIIIALKLVSNPKSVDSNSVIALDWFLVAVPCLFLASQLSYPIWMLHTPLQMLQRPFRFLPLASIALLVSAAYSLTPVSNLNGRMRVVLGALLVLVIAPYCIFQFRLTHSGQQQQRPTPEALTGVYGVAEYLPAISGPHWRDYLRGGGLSGECRRLNIQCSSSLSGGAFHWVMKTANPTALLLPLFAFPAWHITVNGHTSTAMDADTGLFVVNLPAGSSDIEGRWVLLPAERYGLFCTISTCLLLLGITWQRSRDSTCLPEKVQTIDQNSGLGSDPSQ